MAWFKFWNKTINVGNDQSVAKKRKTRRRRRERRRERSRRREKSRRGSRRSRRSRRRSSDSYSSRRGERDRLKRALEKMRDKRERYLREGTGATGNTKNEEKMNAMFEKMTRLIERVAEAKDNAPRREAENVQGSLVELMKHLHSVNPQNAAEVKGVEKETEQLKEKLKDLERELKYKEDQNKNKKELDDYKSETRKEKEAAKLAEELQKVQERARRETEEAVKVAESRTATTAEKKAAEERAEQARAREELLAQVAELTEESKRLAEKAAEAAERVETSRTATTEQKKEANDVKKSALRTVSFANKELSVLGKGGQFPTLGELRIFIQELIQRELKTETVLDNIAGSELSVVYHNTQAHDRDANGDILPTPAKVRKDKRNAISLTLPVNLKDLNPEARDSFMKQAQQNLEGINQLKTRAAKYSEEISAASENASENTKTIFGNYNKTVTDNETKLAQLLQKCTGEMDSLNSNRIKDVKEFEATVEKTTKLYNQAQEIGYENDVIMGDIRKTQTNDLGINDADVKSEAAVVAAATAEAAVVAEATAEALNAAQALDPPVSRELIDVLQDAAIAAEVANNLNVDPAERERASRAAAEAAIAAAEVVRQNPEGVDEEVVQLVKNAAEEANAAISGTPEREASVAAPSPARGSKENRLVLIADNTSNAARRKTPEREARSQSNAQFPARGSELSRNYNTPRDSRGIILAAPATPAKFRKNKTISPVNLKDVARDLNAAEEANAASRSQSDAARRGSPVRAASDTKVPSVASQSFSEAAIDDRSRSLSNVENWGSPIRAASGAAQNPSRRGSQENQLVLRADNRSDKTNSQTSARRIINFTPTSRSNEVGSFNGSCFE